MKTNHKSLGVSTQLHLTLPQFGATSCLIKYMFRQDFAPFRGRLFGHTKKSIRKQITDTLCYTESSMINTLSIQLHKQRRKHIQNAKKREINEFTREWNRYQTRNIQRVYR